VRLCVFCGSKPGRNPAYRDAARAMGALLAREGIGLVYGGASVGLMGEVADAARAAGGEVIGVIPQALVRRELAHKDLDDLRIVHSMHDRKALMAELSDGFIALPGGIGTLEEIFEVWSWAQLGQHAKPCGFLNVEGYYDRLIAFLGHQVAEGFLAEQDRAMIIVEREPQAILSAVRNYMPFPVERWISSAQS
jgi:uncharacterized protein (TIGR00730 family)